MIIIVIPTQNLFLMNHYKKFIWLVLREVIVTIVNLNENNFEEEV